MLDTGYWMSKFMLPIFPDTQIISGMKISISVILVLLLTCSSSLDAISPVLLKRGELIYKNDFSSGSVDKPWKVLQKTRFKVKDGVLHGLPATAENQAARSDHNGPVALIDYILEDQSFIVYAKIQWQGDSQTNGTFELGHHVCAVSFGKNDIILKGELDKKKFTMATIGHKAEKGRWYTLIAEVHGDQVAVQIEDIGEMRGQHAAFKQKRKSLRIRGVRSGAMLLDNLAIYKVDGLL